MQVILYDGESAKEFIAVLAEEVAVIVLNELDERIQLMAKGDEPSDEEVFVTGEEAMKILGIKSKRKLQQIRDERDRNGIEVSQRGRKFMYSKSSLIAYLKNAVK